MHVPAPMHKPINHDGFLLLLLLFIAFCPCLIAVQTAAAAGAEGAWIGVGADGELLLSESGPVTSASASGADNTTAISLQGLLRTLATQSALIQTLTANLSQLSASVETMKSSTAKTSQLVFFGPQAGNDAVQALIPVPSNAILATVRVSARDQGLSIPAGIHHNAYLEAVYNRDQFVRVRQTVDLISNTFGQGFVARWSNASDFCCIEVKNRDSMTYDQSAITVVTFYYN